MKTLLKNVSLRGQIVDVLIEGNRFKTISENITETADKIIDGTGKAIEPAFYNTHTHISMTLLKGLGDNKELHDWLNQDIWPREAKMTPEDIYYASKFAILEMIKGGTVFCNDMYQYGEETMRAIDEMGIRGVVSKPEIDIGCTHEELERRKQKVLDFVDYKNINEERIIKGTSCHAVYTLSDEFLQFYSEIARKNDMYIHIHACETKHEVEECLKKNGCTPIEYLEKFGLLTDKTILAHCVHLSDNDIEIIKKHNTKIAHCPVSNFKLKSGLMAFQKLIKSGVLVTLGTDGSASNNSLGMLEEMKVAALNAKTQANSSKAGNVYDIYKVATENGAKAFGIDAGVIEEGKLADFILYDLDNYLLMPNYNLISNIVYSAQNECITDVFCNGKQLMCNRKVENEREIMEDFKKVAEKFKNIS